MIVLFKAQLTLSKRGGRGDRMLEGGVDGWPNILSPGETVFSKCSLFISSVNG